MVRSRGRRRLGAGPVGADVGHHLVPVVACRQRRAGPRRGGHGRLERVGPGRRRGGLVDRVAGGVRDGGPGDGDLLATGRGGAGGRWPSGPPAGPVRGPPPILPSSSRRSSWPWPMPSPTRRGGSGRREFRQRREERYAACAGSPRRCRSVPWRRKGRLAGPAAGGRARRRGGCATGRRNAGQGGHGEEGVGARRRRGRRHEGVIGQRDHERVVGRAARAHRETAGRQGVGAPAGRRGEVPGDATRAWCCSRSGPC